jgi:hypothetical protein
MKIKVTDSQIFAVNRAGKESVFNYGSTQIDEVGFQAVDNLIDALVKDIAEDEEVFVESKENDVAAKMISRKMEDKIKRSVTLISVRD